MSSFQRQRQYFLERSPIPPEPLAFLHQQGIAVIAGEGILLSAEWLVI